MIIGFKTGPKTWEEGKAIAEEGKVSMCEVWFNVHEQDAYGEIFDALKRNNIRIGLHHWGTVEGQYKTNLSTDGRHIREEAMRQIRETIDVGASIGCVYVNAHPGAQYVEEIDLATFEQHLVPTMHTEADEARNLLHTAAQELHTYAVQQGVLLTIETLPGKEAISGKKRNTPYDPHNTPLSDIEVLAASGIAIGNDITHALSSLVETYPDPTEQWKQFMKFSKTIALQTRLLHINTISPPFNGTDSHDGITPEDFAAGVFPSREQIKEFLSLFTDRNDVYAVPEPRMGTMHTNVDNLRTLHQEMVEENS